MSTDNTANYLKRRPTPEPSARRAARKRILAEYVERRRLMEEAVARCVVRGMKCPRTG